MAKAINIGQTRQIAQRQRLISEQRARQQRECGIFGPRNRQPPVEAIAATYNYSIHALLLTDERFGASLSAS